MKTNYHTHHYLCGHASGFMKDYIEEAIKNHFIELGISDHGPLYDPPFYRMSLYEFKNVYLKEFKQAKEKYQDQIKLLISVEIEFVEAQTNHYHELLKDLDYLILGCHYYSDKPGYHRKAIYFVDTEEKLLEYTNLIERALDTKCFKILAHPDLFFTGYPSFDSFCEKCVERIVDAANRNNVLLELNANGIRKGKTKQLGNEMVYGYPCEDFWKVVKRKNGKVIIGSDCHQPHELNDYATDLATNLAKKLELNIIEKLSDEI